MNIKTLSSFALFGFLGGAAFEAGIKSTDVITKIGDVAVNKVKQLQLSKILSKTKGGVLIGGMYPNGNSAYYGFGL